MASLEQKHLAEAYRVWQTAGWNADYRLTEADFVRSWNASLVKIGCWEGDKLVAVGRANTDGVLYSMIHDVVVDPDFRGKGIGSKVVTELVTLLKARGIRSIQLMSAVGQSAFYQRLGFKERKKDGPGMEYNWKSSREPR